MSLGTDLAAVYFGRSDVPDLWEVGLSLDGAEIVDRGYRRATVSRSAWRVAGSTARATVRFGSFASDVSFDAAVLYRNGKMLESFPFPSVRVVSAGVACQHDVVVDLG